MPITWRTKMSTKSKKGGAQTFSIRPSQGSSFGVLVCGTEKEDEVGWLVQACNLGA